MPTFYAIDTETFPIGKGAPYPQPVCAQVGWMQDGVAVGWLAHLNPEFDDRAAFLEWIAQQLENPEAYFLAVNAQFDFIVLSLEFPELESKIWEAYGEGRVVDLLTAQKFLALAEWGDIESSPFDDPNRQSVYNAAALARWYLSKDRTAEKVSGVRTEYSFVYDTPVPDWPDEFKQYALSDVTDLVDIWPRMLKRAERTLGGKKLTNLAALRARQHFALGWMTQNGMRVDADRLMSIDDEVESELDLDNYPLLIEKGVIRPPQPPQPYANGAKAHVEGCKRKNCDCPVKVAAGKKESLNRKQLQAVTLEAARAVPDFSIKLTDTGVAKHEQAYGERVKSLPAESEIFDAHPEWVCADKKVYTPLAIESPVLKEYARRAAVIKMRTDYVHRFYWDEGNGMSRKDSQESSRKIPERQPEGYSESRTDIQVTDRMRFNFKDLVNTSRTGSFSGKLYPSMNGQNPDPRIRLALGADPGYVLVSTDVAALELRVAAWRCRQLGVDSVLVELLRNGEDPHAYLGAALLRDMGGDDAHFTAGLQGMDCYHAFKALKADQPKLYKLWRTLAKPAGLGFWGGMGPYTALITAHAPPYNLEHITLDQMNEAREVWRREFPEQRACFDHLRTVMRDEPFCKFDDEGEEQVRYFVETPHGAIRRNCVYTEAANGLMLQPPGAEAMEEVCFRTVRASREPGSPTHGVQFLDFLHDELVYQVPIRADYTETHQMIQAVEQQMEEGLGHVLEGIPQAVESAAMYRWDKFAPEAYTEQGWLVPADTPL